MNDDIDDLTYLKNKLEKCLETRNPSACEKLQKQIELLEDAVVIYHEHRSPEKATVYVSDGEPYDPSDPVGTRYKFD